MQGARMMLADDKPFDQMVSWARNCVQAKVITDADIELAIGDCGDHGATVGDLLNAFGLNDDHTNDVRWMVGVLVSRGALAEALGRYYTAP